MKHYDRVIVAITNDMYEHIVGMWSSIKECAIELDLSINAIKKKLYRNSVYRKYNARFEWMVVESE